MLRLQFLGHGIPQVDGFSLPIYMCALYFGQCLSHFYMGEIVIKIIYLLYMILK